MMCYLNHSPRKVSSTCLKSILVTLSRMPMAWIRWHNMVVLYYLRPQLDSHSRMKALQPSHHRRSPIGNPQVNTRASPQPMLAQLIISCNPCTRVTGRITVPCSISRVTIHWAAQDKCSIVGKYQSSGPMTFRMIPNGKGYMSNHIQWG